MQWYRVTTPSEQDARKLRDAIQGIWEYRNRYIDREGSTLVVPSDIPESVVAKTAADLGIKAPCS